MAANTASKRNSRGRKSSGRSNSGKSSRSGRSRSSAASSRRSSATSGSRSRSQGGSRRKSTSGRNTNRSASRTNDGSRRYETAAAEAERESVRNEVKLIAVLAISALLLISLFGIGGTVGDRISYLLYGLFGAFAYLVPFILFIGTAFLMSNEGNVRAVVKTLAAVGFFWTIAGITALSSLASNPIGSLADGYEVCAASHRGGGLLGYLLGYPLSKAFGQAGSTILLVCFMLICAVLVTGRRLLQQFFRYAGRSFRQLGENLENYREERAQARYERMKEEEAWEEEDSPDGQSEPEDFDDIGEDLDEADEKPARRSLGRRKPLFHIMADDADDIVEAEDEDEGEEPDTGKPAAGETARMDDRAEEESEDGITEEKAGMTAQERTTGIGIQGANVKEESGEEAEPDRNTVRRPSPSVDLKAYSRSSAPHSSAEEAESYIADQIEPSGEVSSSWAGDIRVPEFMRGGKLHDSVIRSQNRTPSGAVQRASDGQNVQKSQEAAEAVSGLSEDAAAMPDLSKGDTSDKGETFAQTQEPEESSSIVEQIAARSFGDMPASRAGSFGPMAGDKEETERTAKSRRSRPGAGSKAAGRTSSASAGVRKAADHGGPSREVTSGEASAVIKKKEEQKEPVRYIFPPYDLLKRGSSSSISADHLRQTAVKLQQTFDSFGVGVTVTNVSCGPTVTRYEIQPDTGVKVSKIVSLADDIKLNLAVPDIRIEAPIPGKAAVGIEVPNEKKEMVCLRDLLESEAARKMKSKISFAVGKDIGGQTVMANIEKMPHLLIAGATGSGKSVCINTIIVSILYRAKPDEVKMIMIDPKVVELTVYNGLPHLLIPVVTDPKKAAGALNWAVQTMMDRYNKFSQLGVKDIRGYNAKVQKAEKLGLEGEEYTKMPQIVVIIDELSDLMMVAQNDVESAICRLAQLARAAGIHLVIATQRPSVNVITGLIKANIPSRIAFAVSSGVDSRTILDMNGAEKLLGNGDMLFYPQGYAKPVRVQGAFVSEEEIADITDFIKGQYEEPIQYDEEITEGIEKSSAGIGSQTGAAKTDGERDAYFEEAGRLIISKDKASIGMLQRAFKIGFNRAARIMDQLAEADVVGPELGTKPRKILMKPEEFEELIRTLK